MKEYTAKIRVRYADTDQMGVVYYANYFVWFEVARVEFLRAAGISYKDIEHSGIYLMVVKASCQYRAPALYDEMISVKTHIAKLKNTSMVFLYKVEDANNKLLAEGETVHAFVNKQKRPVKIPEHLRKIFAN